MRRIAILTLILGLVLTACNGGDSDDAAFERVSGDVDPVGPEPTMVEDSDEASTDAEQVSLETPEERKVIQRASISVEAEDTRSVYEEVRRMVEEAGGFVQSATIADPEETEDQPRIDLVVRIPDTDLSNALERIGAMGTRIVAQSEDSEEVTREYQDVESRIRNLSLLEEELRELLADVRQNDDADPQKLLQVFNEISRVRGEIEQLEGRRQLLDNLTSLATVEVKITPTPEATPVVADGWTPLAVARQSIQDLVAAMQGLIDVTIRFGLFLVPLALVAAVPMLALWRFGRRFVVSRDVPSG